MTNDLTLTLAMFVHLKLITKEEAIKLSKKFKENNVPSSIDECLTLTDRIFHELKIGKKKEQTTVMVNGKKVVVTK